MERANKVPQRRRKGCHGRLTSSSTHTHSTTHTTANAPTWTDTYERRKEDRRGDIKRGQWNSIEYITHTHSSMHTTANTPTWTDTYEERRIGEEIKKKRSMEQHRVE